MSSGVQASCPHHRRAGLQLKYASVGNEIVCVKLLKNMGGDKASICHSIFTGSIFILSGIMRFAPNSSVTLRAEMSALGLLGWLCLSQMHANITARHSRQHKDGGRDKRANMSFPPLSRLLRTPVSNKDTPMLNLLSKSFFLRTYQE